MSNNQVDSNGGVVVNDSPYIIGIDLGTSNCSAAVYSKDKKSAILLKCDGKYSMPSAVRFTGMKKDDVVVGSQAKRYELVKPKEVITSAKRKLEDNDWSLEIDSEKLYAEDILSLILNHLVEGIQKEDQLIDLKGSIRRVVICVPANFEDLQKNKIKKAAQKAGLKVELILEEPTAAAIAYGYEKSRSQTILVYDLGGGTFDVTILEIDTSNPEDMKFNVKGKQGIDKCGGDDFDEAIMKLVAEDFKTKSGIDIFDEQNDQGGGTSPKKLREARRKLKHECETAKIDLSTQKVTTIDIPNFLKTGDGSTHVIVDYKLTRETFESLITEKLEETKQCVDRALSEANLSKDDLDRVVLVGGSTKIPMISTILEEMMDKKPYIADDVDTIVAQGAAVRASMLDSVTPDIINITDQVSHHLGIGTANGVFSRIIEKGLELSKEVPEQRNVKEYATQRDSQTDINISIYQTQKIIDDDTNTYVDDDEVKYIGEFSLSGIPEAPAGVEKINVEMSIDQQNSLSVSATSKSQAGITKLHTVRVNS